MSAITAQDVNKLRTMTGAGMMDCKKALTEADGASCLQIPRTVPRLIDLCLGTGDSLYVNVFNHTSCLPP